MKKVLKPKFLAILSITASSIFFMNQTIAKDTYPTKAIKLTVGFPAGQMTDLLTRIIAEKLSTSLDNTVYVENKPGQGGSIALSQLAKSKADGYQLMLSPTAGLVINPNIYKTIGYDTLKDFQAISKIGEVPFVLIANKDMPFDDVKGFIKYAKERPNELTYISPGNGTLPHLGMALLQQKTGTSLSHIPYKGSPAAVADLAASRVDVGFDTEIVTKPFVRDKKIKVLAVTGDERLESMPDVPTLKESGVSDFNLTAWFALVAPRDTPSNIIEVLDQKIKEASQDEEYIRLLKTTGTNANYLSSKEIQKLIKSEHGTWHKVISDAKITID